MLVLEVLGSQLDVMGSQPSNRLTFDSVWTSPQRIVQEIEAQRA